MTSAIETNKNDLLAKLNENRSLFFGNHSSSGQGHHWTTIIGLDGPAQGFWPEDIAKQLSMPVPLFVLERSFFLTSQSGQERYRWAKAVIKALPDNDSAEQRHRICRRYIRSLVTHKKIGLAASLGDIALPSEIAAIIDLLDKGSSDRVAFVRASGDAFNAVQRDYSLQGKIINQALCSAGQFAFHFANPESAETAIKTGTNGLVSASAARVKLNALRNEDYNAKQVAHEHLGQTLSICKKIFLKSLSSGHSWTKTGMDILRRCAG